MSAPPSGEDEAHHPPTAPEEAALESVQPERLLAGEDEDTPYVADAVHWMKVYSELMDFKRYILGLTEARVHGMEAAAAAEVKETDLRLLEAEAQRFERRLAFWRERAAALEDQPQPPA